GEEVVGWGGGGYGGGQRGITGQGLAVIPIEFLCRGRGCHRLRPRRGGPMLTRRRVLLAGLAFGALAGCRGPDALTGGHPSASMAGAPAVGVTRAPGPP